MLIALRLIGPDGKAVPLGPVAAQGSVLQAAVPAGLPDGTYLLSWRMTSTDSHPVAGSAAFGVGVPAGAAPDAAQDQPRTALPSQVVRWLYYAALMATAGGALFRAAVVEVPAPLRRELAGAALLGVVLAVAQVGLRGALLAGAGLADVLEGASWRLGAGTTLATSLLVSGLGLLGCALAMRQAGPWWRLLGALAALVALAGFPLSGHAVTAGPRWLTVPSLALHTLAVAFWLGAFLPLLAVLRGPALPAIAAVRRFSALAVPAVGVLVVTGTLLSAVQVQTFGSLLGSTYGLLLLSKLAGVAGLVGIAAWNRLHLTPAMEAGHGQGAAGLRGSIVVELALAGLVLAVTSGLTLVAPPAMAHGGHDAHNHRGHGHAEPAGIAVATEGAGLLAVVEVMPGRPGPNRIAVMLNRASGPAPAPIEVWAVLSQDAAGMGPIRRRLLPGADGRFAQQGLELSIPGRWRIAVEVLVTDFKQVTLATEIEIR